jgi:outer membrane receptor protein involved in Fe transport
LQWKWNLSEQLIFKPSMSFANSHLLYMYDEDWSHPGICDGLACDEKKIGKPVWYRSVDRYQRHNQHKAMDLRWLFRSSSHKRNQPYSVFGYYEKQQSIDLKHKKTQTPLFKSQFKTKNRAVYGQYHYLMSSRQKITAGLRLENRQGDYIDNTNRQQKTDFLDEALMHFSPNDTMWGGKLSLTQFLPQQNMLYASISKGYKIGGFNANRLLSENAKKFTTETQWNYELGGKIKAWNQSLTSQFSLFYQNRRNIQTKQSLMLSKKTGKQVNVNDPCPCDFVDYIDNAAKGVNYGLEIQTQWRPIGHDSILFYIDVGLLHTKYLDFTSFVHAKAQKKQKIPIAYDLSGRIQAYSPKQQKRLGFKWFLNEALTFNIEQTSKSAFYLSDRHDQKSQPYKQWNIHITYQWKKWVINGYGLNLTNQRIETRGFANFGNDPRKFYTPEPYYQLSRPKVFGLSITYQFN